MKCVSRKVLFLALVVSPFAIRAEIGLYDAPLSFVEFKDPRNGSDFENPKNSQNLNKKEICIELQQSARLEESFDACVAKSSFSDKCQKQKVSCQITPPANPVSQQYAGMFITADFIYWKASTEGIQYAFSGSVGTGGYIDQINAPSGVLKLPEFTYQPGFKVGLGADCRHDDWDVFAQYTRLASPYSSSNSSLKGGNATTNLVQGTNIWGYLGISPIYSEVSSGWSLNFNVLDFELGRNFWISKWITLRPFLGLKLSWLDQHHHVEGDSIANGLSAGIVAFDWKLSQFGVGLRTGLNSAYYMWHKWSIYGDMSITSMWNSFDSDRVNEFQLNSSSPVYTNANVHAHPNSLSAILELALGLRFETGFQREKYRYMLQAGWEDQIWFGQGNFIHFHNPSSPSNLYTQGLTIKTAFYF